MTQPSLADILDWESIVARFEAQGIWTPEVAAAHQRYLTVRGADYDPVSVPNTYYGNMLHEALGFPNAELRTHIQRLATSWAFHP